ncbi:hypothetical protein CIPAW_03G049300 [Carya illinoinensis]|uniref:Lysosomal cystine transporter n=1 Tax=Carya illinoinensis TaxID=32201 RepID=A0A8T1QWZ1_CARIL|nr:hypothetical protein CIPAW_03G049300 [Carya illinoinensis]KAG6720129.1 hypothetical protein I3842_03G044200 [Carya illinoinensis]
MEVMYQVLGWTPCLSWTTTAYPQVISNFLLNLTKHSSYLIYNASLYFSSTIQKQYYEKYGYDEMIPVAANDVVFSANTVLMTAVILFQILIYERGNQKVSKIAITIVSDTFMNFARKSKDGFNIGNILLDFCGGVANYAQMAVQSIDQGSQVKFNGNMGKMLLSLVRIISLLVFIFFDIIFMCQRFVLYPRKKSRVSPKLIVEIREPLVKPADCPQSENV